MLGRGIVREDALAVADGLADRLVGKVALGPDPADQPLRHLAAVDRQVVHELRLLRELLHDLRALGARSEEHTSELQSLMRISYAVFCWKKKKHLPPSNQQHDIQQ